MARGGFLGRIGRAIRNIVAPSPPPERPREEPPEEPRERPPSDRDYRREWRSQGGKGNYKKNLALFHAQVDSIEDDPQERLMIWEAYIKYINRGEGRYRRNSSNNMFWRISGIDPDNWSWARWREAMGYTGKNRSRTS